MTRKKVSFSQPLELVKHFNHNDPPSTANTTNTFELNFTSCKLLSENANHNTLPYVRLSLGNDANCFKTVGLLDTGCSWSICEYIYFLVMR